MPTMNRLYLKIERYTKTQPTKFENDLLLEQWPPTSGATFMKSFPNSDMTDFIKFQCRSASNLSSSSNGEKEVA